MFVYYLQRAWSNLISIPALSALIILAIALGISLSMTTYTVYYQMSRDPIPEKSQNLYAVQLESYAFQGNTTTDKLNYQITYQDAIRLLDSDIPAHQTPMLRTGFSISTELEDIPPFTEVSRAINNDFFNLFNLQFIYGSPWDDSADRSPEYVTVIAQSLNEKLFGGTDSVGKTLLLNDYPYTIVGVVQDFQPTPFFYDLNNGDFYDAEQIFVPFSLIPLREFPSWGNQNSPKAEHIDSYQMQLTSEMYWIQYWVELNNDQSVRDYRQFLSGYIQEQKKVGRFEHPSPRYEIRDVISWISYNDVVTEDNKVLVGLSFMFLIVCLINALGLLLAKFIRQISETAVRRALGASQWQVLQQHLIEVGIIGLIGGAVGLMLAWLGLRGLNSLYNNYQNLTELDWTLVLVTIFISILSTLVAGLFPALRVCSTPISGYLKTE